MKVFYLKFPHNYPYQQKHSPNILPLYAHQKKVNSTTNYYVYLIHH
jgi:hypothetical protein